MNATERLQEALAGSEEAEAVLHEAMVDTWPRLESHLYVRHTKGSRGWLPFLPAKAHRHLRILLNKMGVCGLQLSVFRLQLVELRLRCLIFRLRCNERCLGFTQEMKDFAVLNPKSGLMDFLKQRRKGAK